MQQKQCNGGSPPHILPPAALSQSWPVPEPHWCVWVTPPPLGMLSPGRVRVSGTTSPLQLLLTQVPDWVSSEGRPAAAHCLLKEDAGCPRGSLLIEGFCSWQVRRAPPSSSSSSGQEGMYRVEADIGCLLAGVSRVPPVQGLCAMSHQGPLNPCRHLGGKHQSHADTDLPVLFCAMQGVSVVSPWGVQLPQIPCLAEPNAPPFPSPLPSSVGEWDL